MSIGHLKSTFAENNRLLIPFPPFFFCLFEPTLFSSSYVRLAFSVSLLPQIKGTIILR